MLLFNVTELCKVIVVHVLLRASTKLIENIVCLSKHVQLVNDLSKLLFFNSVIEQVLFLHGGKKLMKQCYLWSNQYAESLAEQSNWWLINQVDVGNTAGCNYSSQDRTLMKLCLAMCLI